MTAKDGLIALCILWGIANGDTDSGALEIKTAPPGAQIFINGQFAGATPITLDDLKPGSYLVKAVLSGYLPWSMAVDVKSRHLLDIPLETLPAGTVTFNATPASGEVIVDGRSRGETPLELILPVGEHSIEIAAEGFLPWHKTVTVTNEASKVTAELASRAEHFLTARLEEAPWRVAYAYELAHHYLVKGNGPKALEALERGLRASVDPRAPTGEAGRLTEEIRSFHGGLFKFDASQFPDGIQPEIIKMLKRVSVDQPRNTYAADILGALLPANEALELYRTTVAALKTPRAKLYFDYLLNYKLYPEAAKLYTAANALRTAWAALAKKSRTSKKKEDIDAATAKKVEADKAYADAIVALQGVIDNYPTGPYSATVYQYLNAIYKSYLPDHAKLEATVYRQSKDFPEQAFALRSGLAAWWASTREYAKAETEFRKILKEFPDNDGCPTLHQQLINCLIEQKKDAAVIAENEEMLKRYPQSDGIVAVIENLITRYTTLGKTTRAEELKQLIVSDFSHTTYAQKYENEALRTERLAAQRRFDETQPDRTLVAKLHSEKAKATAKIKKLEQEIQKQKAKPAAPVSAQAAKSKKSSNGNTESAPRSEQQLELDKLKVEIEAIEEKKLTLALNVIARLRPITLEHRKLPAARTAQKTIIQLCQTHLPDPEDTAEAMREYIQLFPDDDYCPTYQSQIAQVYVTANKKDEAVREYRKYLNDYPEHDNCPQMYQALIGQLLNEKDVSLRARWAKEIDKFIERYPNHSISPTLLYTRSMLYYYQSFPGDRELCIKDFQLGAKLYPTHSSILACERYRTFIGDGMQPEESNMEPKIKIDYQPTHEEHE